MTAQEKAIRRQELRTLIVQCLCVGIKPPAAALAMARKLNPPRQSLAVALVGAEHEAERVKCAALARCLPRLGQ